LVPPSSEQIAAPSVPVRLRSVDVAGPAGRLEALLNEGLPHAPFAALVCHPHPMGGGSMHNKVVYRAMKVLNHPSFGFGFPVLRFNFRGTGLSQGEHHGRREVEDVHAAIDWLAREYHRPLILAGFSFGAAMAISACCTGSAAASRVRALIALGLPLAAEGRSYSYPTLAACTVPKLFLSGDRDLYSSPDNLQRIVAAASEPKQLVMIPGADHFFTDKLALMQAALADWLAPQLSHTELSRAELSSAELPPVELPHSSAPPTHSAPSTDKEFAQ
jgi:alpha/beta superfamily hydrolase